MGTKETNSFDASSISKSDRFKYAIIIREWYEVLRLACVASGHQSEIV